MKTNDTRCTGEIKYRIAIPKRRSEQGVESFHQHILLKFKGGGCNKLSAIFGTRRCSALKLEYLEK